MVIGSRFRVVPPLIGSDHACMRVTATRKCLTAPTLNDRMQETAPLGYDGTLPTGRYSHAKPL